MPFGARRCAGRAGVMQACYVVAWVSAAASSLGVRTGESVALIHRFERIVFGWDLQHDHVLHPAVRMGLDGAYSDHVDLMMAVHEADLPAGPAATPSAARRQGRRATAARASRSSTVATMSMTSGPMLSWLRSSDR